MQWHLVFKMISLCPKKSENQDLFMSHRILLASSLLLLLFIICQTLLSGESFSVQQQRFLTALSDSYLSAHKEKKMPKEFATLNATDAIRALLFNEMLRRDHIRIHLRSASGGRMTMKPTIYSDVPEKPTDLWPPFFRNRYSSWLEGQQTIPMQVADNSINLFDTLSFRIDLNRLRNIDPRWNSIDVDQFSATHASPALCAAMTATYLRWVYLPDSLDKKDITIGLEALGLKRDWWMISPHLTPALRRHWTLTAVVIGEHLEQIREQLSHHTNQSSASSSSSTTSSLITLHQREQLYAKLKVDFGDRIIGTVLSPETEAFLAKTYGITSKNPASDPSKSQLKDQVITLLEDIRLWNNASELLDVADWGKKEYYADLMMGAVHSGLLPDPWWVARMAISEYENAYRQMRDDNNIQGQLRCKKKSSAVYQLMPKLTRGAYVHGLESLMQMSPDELISYQKLLMSLRDKPDISLLSPIADVTLQWTLYEIPPSSSRASVKFCYRWKEPQGASSAFLIRPRADLEAEIASRYFQPAIKVALEDMIGFATQPRGAPDESRRQFLTRLMNEFPDEPIGRTARMALMDWQNGYMSDREYLYVP